MTTCHGTCCLYQGLERGTLDDVPEGMNVDLAHKLTEREAQEAKERRRWQELAEIGEVIILAIVAVATAWSGYQAARWDGRQAFQYGTASRLRVQADEADTLGGQQRLLDVSTFNTWIQAHEEGNRRLADLYVRRFSDEYRVAFEAGRAGRPHLHARIPQRADRARLHIERTGRCRLRGGHRRP
jgi:hypothetical protein